MWTNSLCPFVLASILDDNERGLISIIVNFLSWVCLCLSMSYMSAYVLLNLLKQLRLASQFISFSRLFYSIL